MPLLALALVNVVVHTGGRHIDLEVYRFGVQAWLAGGDMYGTLPETSDHITLPFIYPPFAAIVLLPLAVAPWVLAWSALLALSTAALGLTFFVVARRLWPSGGAAARCPSRRSRCRWRCRAAGQGHRLQPPAPPIPAFALEPVMQTIEFGQVNLLLMALVAVDVLVARPRWPRGLLIGIAAAIKLTPAAFVLYFLLRREYRAAAVAAVSTALVTGLAFLVAPGPSWQFWLDNPAGGVSGSPFFTNQTFQAVLVRAGVDGSLKTVLWLVLSVGVLALAAPAIRRAPPPLALMATAGVALLVSPTSWSHHWVWVAPFLLVAAASAWRARSFTWLGVTLAVGGRLRRGAAPAGPAARRHELDDRPADLRRHLRLVHGAPVRRAVVEVACGTLTWWRTAWPSRVRCPTRRGRRTSSPRSAARSSRSSAAAVWA